MRMNLFFKVVVLTIYVLFGAWIFVKIEKTDELNETTANQILEVTKETFSRQIGVNITDQEFSKLVSNISEAILIRLRPEWTFWKGLEFAIISLTTVGYGNTTPRTPLGQGVFIIYAIIGIPLTMVTLKNTGELMKSSIRKLIIAFEKKMLGKQEHKNMTMKCFVLSLFFVMLIFIYLPFAFVYANKISFLEGLYATFVVASTIGFGDYVLDFKAIAGKTGSTGISVSMIVAIPVLLANLTILSCFLNATIDLVKVQAKKILLCREPPQ